MNEINYDSALKQAESIRPRSIVMTEDQREFYNLNFVNGALWARDMMRVLEKEKEKQDE